MTFAPDEAAGDGTNSAIQASDAAGPSLFTALQEHLGLRLKAAKDPVEVLVIDHVERPGQN